MATISKAFLGEFTHRIDSLTEAAQKMLSDRLSLVDIYDREAVASVFRSVCEPFTDMSAALTCEFYDEIRLGANAPGKYSAKAYSGYDSQAATRAAYSVWNEMEEDTLTVPVAQALGDASSRMINNASRETVRQNARRDPAKPKYASVPTSATPCAWCVMRASAGFVYSEDAGSHNHCKCRLVPGFKGSEKIEGYDTSEYEEEWRNADRAYRQGNYSEEMAQKIKDARQRHTEAYEEYKRTGVAKDGVTKPWDNTNAILMVMREQRKE